MSEEAKLLDPRIIQMRQFILESVSKKYQSLAETINKIPLQQDFKVEAIRLINSGFLWAKEGINLINFNFETEQKITNISSESSFISTDIQNDLKTEL